MIYKIVQEIILPHEVLSMLFGPLLKKNRQLKKIYAEGFV